MHCGRRFRGCGKFGSESVALCESFPLIPGCDDLETLVAAECPTIESRRPAIRARLAPAAGFLNQSCAATSSKSFFNSIGHLRKSAPGRQDLPATRFLFGADRDRLLPGTDRRGRGCDDG